MFTFDFDDSRSLVLLELGATVRIHGVAYGGRDIGPAYANDAHRGLYTFDFTYSNNLGAAANGGVDDLRVGGMFANSGWIKNAAGTTWNLEDKPDGTGFTFFLGDEGGAGHRGFAGISGWGWLNHTPAPGDPGSVAHVASSDRLFHGDADSRAACVAPRARGLGVLGLAARRAGGRRGVSG